MEYYSTTQRSELMAHGTADESPMHSTKSKKPISEIRYLCPVDSIYMAFWRRQTCQYKELASGCPSLRQTRQLE
jgi:hypothetical protein